MSQRLKNILAFNLAAGATVTIPHGLTTSAPRPLVPDIVFIPSADLSVVATTTTATLTNNGPTQLTGNVLVEAWHTIERSFGDVNDEELVPQPYIVVGAEQGNTPPQPPYPDPNVNIYIYARITGNDTTGDGKTPATAYRTLQRAVRDVVSIIPTGISYFVDYTGIGQETLPDGYELPTWKAPAGFWYDDSDPYFPIRGAVNLRAVPQLVASLGANAIITEADLVPTTVGGGIADVAGFLDERNAGTGSGTDTITDEGDGIAKLTISGEEFDGEVTFITIAGATNAANDGTFPVVGTDGESVFYENASVVAEATFGGTYSAFIPRVFVETTTDHGLWNVEFPVQNVIVAGVTGTIAPAANGDHTVLRRTKNTFIFQSDDPTVDTLVYGGGGTVSVLFVQDPASGNVQVKTTKNFGANDSLAGKLFISSFNEFWNAVIWRNTADTLYITQCFAPGAFGTPIGDDFRVMEQSAELLTTCSFAGIGSRRGDRRGGLTIADCDSITLNGTKVTPLNEGEVGVCQLGGMLASAMCHLTTARFNDAQGGAMLQCSYLNGAKFKGSAVDLERCFFENLDDPTNNSAVGWVYAYFGTVFHNVTFSFDSATQSSLFGCFFFDQGPLLVSLGAGRNDWDNVGFENISDFVFAASSAITRNAITRCDGTALPGTIMVMALNGGTFLVRSDVGPFGDASFTNPGDFMVVDGLPERTFEDFRQHALLDLTSLTANFDTVFEAIFPFTSTAIPFFGEPVYPSISVTGRAPDAGGVIVTYNPVTGLVGISYETGVSTVLAAETAVDSFAWPDAGGIRTKTPGTPGNVLTSPGDDLVATLLDVGVNGPCGEYTNIRSNPKTGSLDCPGPLGTQSTVIAYSLS